MILITDIDKFLIQTIILYMSTAFKVKDLGPRDTSWVLRLSGLPQRTYTLDFLQDSALLDVKPLKVLMK